MKDCYHILCQAFFLPAKPGIRKRQASACEIQRQEAGKPGFRGKD